MKRMKSILYISVIPSILIMVFLGTVYGGSVTVQRETGLQTGQESTVTKGDVNKDGDRLTFSPQRLKIKIDSGRESEADSRMVKTERYKPYQQGEGERKTR